MKIKLTVITIGMFWLLLFSARAQTSQAPVLKSIMPHALEITLSKTTHMVFPFAILSADRGSRDVLVQKAKGAENILQVKAAKENIQETNLTVLTADGKLHSFIVTYAAAPALLNIVITNGTAPLDSIHLTPEYMNRTALRRHAEKAAEGLRQLRGIGDKKFGIRFLLNGLFIHEDILYCRIQIENHSGINYDINGLRFFIRDQKKMKRTATQEIEVLPLTTYNETNKIKGGTVRTIVFALPKFTIPDHKYLRIQLMEKNGGRHLTLRVSNKTIAQAALLRHL